MSQLDEFQRLRRRAQTEREPPKHASSQEAALLLRCKTSWQCNHDDAPFVKAATQLWSCINSLILSCAKLAAAAAATHKLHAAWNGVRRHVVRRTNESMPSIGFWSQAQDGSCCFCEVCVGGDDGAPQWRCWPCLGHILVAAAHACHGARHGPSAIR